MSDEVAANAPVAKGAVLAACEVEYNQKVERKAILIGVIVGVPFVMAFNGALHTQNYIVAFPLLFLGGPLLIRAAWGASSSKPPPDVIKARIERKFAELNLIKNGRRIVGKESQIVDFVPSKKLDQQKAASLQLELSITFIWKLIGAILRDLLIADEFTVIAISANGNWFSVEMSVQTKNSSVIACTVYSAEQAKCLLGYNESAFIKHFGEPELL